MATVPLQSCFPGFSAGYHGNVAQCILYELNQHSASCKLLAVELHRELGKFLGWMHQLLENMILHLKGGRDSPQNKSRASLSSRTWNEHLISHRAATSPLTEVGGDESGESKAKMLGSPANADRNRSCLWPQGSQAKLSSWNSSAQGIPHTNQKAHPHLHKASMFTYSLNLRITSVRSS